MPILLPEDAQFPLPKMRKARQIFPRPRIDDIEAAVREQMRGDGIRSRIAPGAKVAVAVGSRGIRNLPLIAKSVLDCVRAAGGKPFIVAAMGSHGGASEQGQRKTLAGYGITEEAMGAPIVAAMDVEHVGRTSLGADVYFDRAAMGADLIVPINRVKLHTDFSADIQSGLCKMLVIGLGNHVGCSAMHERGFEALGESLPEAAGMILKKAPVGFGIAVVENAYDETALVEAVPAEKIVEREKELLKISLTNMPTLMIPEIDVLVVEEIGKNISGAGFDPNILGKSRTLKTFALPVPRIGRMALLGVSEPSRGNALGMGAFDVITRKAFERVDLEATYANAIASKSTEDAKIPIIADDEEQALRVAIKILIDADRENLKIVKIKNTLELETIEVSETLLPHVRAHERMALV